MSAPVAITDNFNSISSGTSWSERHLLDGIQENNDISGRIGRRINLTSFYFDGILGGGQNNVALDDRVNVVRIVLGLWTRGLTTPCATNSFAMSSVINRAGYTVTGGASLIRKFRDFKVVLRSPGRDSTGYLPAIKRIRIYVKFKKPLQFIFANSGASNDVDKMFVLSMLSDSGAIPNPGFVSGSWYLKWVDP